eukprot:g4347.t1
MIKIRNVPVYSNPTPRATSNDHSLKENGEKSRSEGNKHSSERRRTNLKDINDDFEKLQEGVIGEEYLIKATGQSDLSKITLLCLKVDTTEHSLYDMHTHLISLQELVLDGSFLLSIRDLGTGLSTLQVRKHIIRLLV